MQLLGLFTAVQGAELLAAGFEGYQVAKPQFHSEHSPLTVDRRDRRSTYPTPVDRRFRSDGSERRPPSGASAPSKRRREGEGKRRRDGGKVSTSQNVGTLVLTQTEQTFSC